MRRQKDGCDVATLACTSASERDCRRNCSVGVTDLNYAGKAAYAGNAAMARTGSSDTGKTTRNKLPCPGALSTEISPWSARMMPNAAARLSPRPVNLVVKNGSKMQA